MKENMQVLADQDRDIHCLFTRKTDDANRIWWFLYYFVIVFKLGNSVFNKNILHLQDLVKFVGGSTSHDSLVPQDNVWSPKRIL